MAELSRDPIIEAERVSEGRVIPNAARNIAFAFHLLRKRIPLNISVVYIYTALLTNHPDHREMFIGIIESPMAIFRKSRFANQSDELPEGRKKKGEGKR
jgi:hypothetical protein